MIFFGNCNEFLVTYLISISIESFSGQEGRLGFAALSFQHDGNIDICIICNEDICYLYLLMGNMKPYDKIHGCGQPYVIYIFIATPSVEFTNIFIIIINLRP